jgi:hypothetical protein
MRHNLGTWRHPADNDGLLPPDSSSMKGNYDIYRQIIAAASMVTISADQSTVCRHLHWTPDFCQTIVSPSAPGAP